MSQYAAAIPLLTPNALNIAGVKLEDAVWLHAGPQPLVQKLATDRGASILKRVRDYVST